MSRTFTKLFSSITESTIWCEPDRTRIVWICMLAMADAHGRVWASIPGLANRARVPVEDCRVAIAAFLAPDPDSRTPDNDGRRIEAIDGGWRLLNYLKYREVRDEESAKEAKRKYINARRARERESNDVDQCRSQSNEVERSRDNEEAEEEAEAEVKVKKTARKRSVPDPLPPWVDADAWSGFEAMRKAIRKPLTDAARRLAISELAKLRDAGQDPTEVLRQSTFRSWAGLFAVKSDDIPRPGGPRVVGAMSEHGMQTMRNAQALERRLFGDVEVSDAP